jgi:3-oxoacyl-[acyl-carrier protein] reductase
MLLKDRVMLITNVEKFAGHGTTEWPWRRARRCWRTILPFRSRRARRKYESHYPARHALSAPSRKRWSSWR